MRMYTGDLEPDLEVTISDASGPIDLSAATTSVRILGKLRDDIIFDRTPTTVDAVGDTSVVTMAWQTGDTDEVGRIQIEVEATWPGAKPQTFRPSGGVDVLRDFDLTP